MRVAGNRTLSYVAVIAVGKDTFLFPWLWLLSTSPKPPEQIVQIAKIDQPLCGLITTTGLPRSISRGHNN